MLSCLCASVSILCHCAYPSHRPTPSPRGEKIAVCTFLDSLSSVYLFICCKNIYILLVEKGNYNSQLVSMYVYYYYSFFKSMVIHCLAFLNQFSLCYLFTMRIKTACESLASTCKVTAFVSYI